MKRAATDGLSVLVGIDKPVGLTSHDVVGRLRRALGVRRIGHAGTLDPLASGVMVVGIGQATRLMGLATAENKRYLARLSFGRETVTDDAEGQTRRQAAVPPEVASGACGERGMEVLRSMTSQVPPIYSAIQVGGVRAYDAARKGEEMELAERPISVEEAFFCGTGVFEEGDDAGLPWWDVVVSVSKGTYVRALARDLGRALGTACHVASLRRLQSGSVGISSCSPLAEVEERGAQALRPLDPAEVLQCAEVPLSEDDVAAVCNGRRLSAVRTAGGCAREAPEGERLALVRDGRLYALAARSGGALVPGTVFPGGIATRM